MTEYIEREDVLHKLLHTDSVYGAYMSIVKIKPADVVERKHGKWIHGIDEETGEQDLYAWTCSLCGEKYPWQPNYCPYCGARMDGDKDV